MEIYARSNDVCFVDIGLSWRGRRYIHMTKIDEEVLGLYADGFSDSPFKTTADCPTIQRFAIFVVRCKCSAARGVHVTYG